MKIFQYLFNLERKYCLFLYITKSYKEISLLMFNVCHSYKDKLWRDLNISFSGDELSILLNITIFPGSKVTWFPYLSISRISANSCRGSYYGHNTNILQPNMRHHYIIYSSLLLQIVIMFKATVSPWITLS